MFNIVKIDEELNQVDHISLRDLADFFEKQAEILRHKSMQDSKSNDEQTAGAIDFLLRTPRIVMRHLKTGCTREEALQRTADLTGAPLATIERAWKRFLYDKSDYELRRRNRLILELAALGLKNADIGKKMNLHPNSVSRIIGAARRAYHLPRSPEPDMIPLDEHPRLK